MYHILFFPTRYFPAISGAEFYIQSIAEILKSKYNYVVDVYTSTAIDFKGLRHINGKIITPGDKYYDRVNDLKITRYPVKYDVNIDDKLRTIKKFAIFESLRLSDECLIEFLKNGPFLTSLIEKIKLPCREIHKKVDPTLEQLAKLPKNSIVKIILTSQFRK